MDSLEDNSQAPSSRQQMRKLLFLNTWASMQILNPLKGQSAAAIERSKPPLDAIAKARRGLLSFEEEAELVEKHTYMKKKPKPPDSQASRIYSHLPGIFLLVLAVLWTAGALFAASFLIFSALAIAFISLFVPPQFMVETITPAMRKLTMYMLQQQVEALNDKIEHRTNTSSKTLTPATIHDASSDLRREVQVRVMVEHLWDINSSRHYFHADVLLEASWVADETADEWLALLKHQADWDAGLPPDEYWQNLALEVQEGLNKRTIDCWKPDLYFGNLIEVHEEAMRNIVPGENYEKWYRIKVTDAGQLRICERSRVVGDFAELFELHYFPADRQALTVEVRLLRMASDGFGWLRMASDGFRWLRMASDGFGWLRMASDSFGPSDPFGWLLECRLAPSLSNLACLPSLPPPPVSGRGAGASGRCPRRLDPQLRGQSGGRQQGRRHRAARGATLKRCGGRHLRRWGARCEREVASGGCPLVTRLFGHRRAGDVRVLRTASDCF